LKIRVSAVQFRLWAPLNSRKSLDVMRLTLSWVNFAVRDGAGASPDLRGGGAFGLETQPKEHPLPHLRALAGAALVALTAFEAIEGAGRDIGTADDAIA
jgi:hypothetical protein